MWWIKSRRAQSVDDYETWISGGVVPTLNQFDGGDTRATVLIIDGTRVNDVRVYDDGVVPTVVARYGTGGGNVPMIFDNSTNTETIAFDTQFGSNANTFENLSPTLKASQQAPSVLESNVYPIQGTVIGRSDTAGPQGKGYSNDETMFTLTKTDVHAVAENKTVRRLTPVECERLQGFPDNWTEGQADSNRYKQMGNAVAVPVVNWVVARLVANK
jgi:DNA (cytosine-5)-methyltransferase 1